MTFRTADHQQQCDRTFLYNSEINDIKKIEISQGLFVLQLNDKGVKRLYDAESMAHRNIQELMVKYYKRIGKKVVKKYCSRER